MKNQFKPFAVRLHLRSLPMKELSRHFPFFMFYSLQQSTEINQNFNLYN